MPDHNLDPDEWADRFERLDWTGKARFLGSTLFYLAGRVVEEVTDRTAHLIDDSARAFLQGADPNIDDAKILEEYVEDRRNGEEGQ